jgi:hypothetical protein
MGSFRRESAPGRARRVGRRGASALILAAALAAAQIPAAFGNEVQSVIERCAHGQSLAGFSEPALAKALRELSTVLQEYSNCEELIRRAELAGATRTPGSPSARAAGLAGAPGSSFGGEAPIPPTAAEQPALAAARHLGSTPQRLGGRRVTPGVVHVDLGSAISSLPDSLIAVLAALAALALAAAGRLVLTAATGSGASGKLRARAIVLRRGKHAPGGRRGDGEEPSSGGSGAGGRRD